MECSCYFLFKWFTLTYWLYYIFIFWHLKNWCDFDLEFAKLSYGKRLLNNDTSLYFISWFMWKNSKLMDYFTIRHYIDYISFESIDTRDDL